MSLEFFWSRGHLSLEFFLVMTKTKISRILFDIYSRICLDIICPRILLVYIQEFVFIYIQEFVFIYVRIFFHNIRDATPV